LKIVVNNKEWKGNRPLRIINDSKDNRRQARITKDLNDLARVVVNSRKCNHSRNKEVMVVEMEMVVAMVAEKAGVKYNLPILLIYKEFP